METGKSFVVIFWKLTLLLSDAWTFPTIFRFLVRLDLDCVSSGVQRNTNPGQYWPILCEQELISYLGLTLTRVYELSMRQFTSWS